jgi:hypothetical protein
VFSFLNASLLWALPLAATPLLLHLIFLRRARRLPFGDLTLLRAAYARSLPSTRLRQWLILLLRCLALAMLVFAFARPVFHNRTQTAAGAEQGLDLVILTDVSWSMRAETRGKSRLDWAVASGRDLLELLRPADRVAVAAFSDQLDAPLAWSESPSAAEAALRRLQPGAKTTDVGAALKSAFAFLGPPAAQRRRIIAVLSDNAKHAVNNLPAGGVAQIPGYDEKTLLLGLHWEGEPINGGIFDVRPQDGADGVLRVRPLLYSTGESRPSWNLDLFVRERRDQQRSLTLEADRGRVVNFRLPPSNESERWGRLALRRDGLEADDDYYFALRLQPRPRILLLYGSPSYLEAGRGGYFLKKLMGEDGDLPYRLDLADVGRLDQIRLEDYGAVMVADFREFPARVAQSLKRYVLRGGGLWVLAGTQAGRDAYRELRALLPGDMDEPVNYARESVLRLGEVPTAPLAGRFKWDEFELGKVAIGRSYPLRLGDTPVSVWFRDSGGRPLLTERTFGRGRVLLYASALDLRWSNLALKPIFAAWMDVGLRHLSGYSGRQAWKTLQVGEPIKRHWGAGEAVPSKVQIRGPGGRRSTLLVRDRQISFQETRAPGLYFLQPVGGGAGGRPEVFAVNLDRTGPEGDLRVSGKLPWVGLRPEYLREDFLRAVYGREIRTGALALALLLLLLEAWFARPRGDGHARGRSSSVARSGALL